MNKTITFQGDEKLDHLIDKESRLEGQSRDEFISKTLKGALLMRAAKRAREKFTPIAEAHGYHTDEDVFRDF